MIDQNSQFFAILTAVGEAKQANATALGVSWTFTQMGVGDANNTDPIPSRTQTKLINEWRRAPVNQVRPDPANPNIIITEQVIPADVGGKWIREIALYDADGDMVAVANCAPSFKPLLVQGTGKTQVIRMNFIVTSTANIVLKIDPAVVLATREYVDTQIIEALAKLDFKHSVLVATTANIALNGLQTIDGVLLPADARVLVKNQAAANENGLYVVSSSGVWKRSQDADSSVEVTPGLFVSVEKGAANGDSVWQLVTDAPIVLGTTALVFEMAAGRTGIAAGSYRSVTVDKYGRVIAGTNPTTLASSGITDALPLTGGTLTGSLNLTDAKSVYIRPVQSPSWAAGLIAGEFNGEKAGIGYLGSNDSVNVVFMGLGATPWVNGYGIRVSTGGVEIAGPISGDGAGLTGLKFSALTGLPNSLSAYGVPFASQVEAETGADTNKPMNALRTFQAIAAKVIQATESKLGTAQIASKVLVDAGDDDSTIVTPKKQRWGFRILIGRAGYIVFPTWLKGWIVQWNVGVSLTGSAINTSYFPIPFPTDVGAVVVGAYNNSGSGSYTVCLSDGTGGSKGAVFADRFTTYNNGVTGSAGMSYIAVGT
jgi:hypothetical protein